MEKQLEQFQEYSLSKMKNEALLSEVNSAISGIGLSGEVPLQRVAEYSQLFAQKTDLENSIANQDIDITALSAEIVTFYNAHDMTAVRYVNGDKAQKDVDNILTYITA